MQKISFVIPCYRSEHTLAAVHEELTATMQTLPQYDYEVVLINDCSPDYTIGTIDYAVTMRKNETDLYQLVGRILGDMGKDGTLSALYQKHGLTPPGD